MKRYQSILLTVLFGLTYASSTIANADQKLQGCLLEQLRQSEDKRTVGDIEKWCKASLSEQEKEQTRVMTALEKRIAREQSTSDNPSVITPHNRNYVLPFAYMDKPNSAPYRNETDIPGELDNWEAKFQLSFKAPVAESLMVENDRLFVGFTLQSYWQMYNSEISAPFRETNYQPEVFYAIPAKFKLGNWTNLVNIFGFEHQSNGQSRSLSRSWNRIYANFVWENGDWVIGFKPWYRLSEDEKESPTSAKGDDNPDIHKYMGNFELSSAFKWDGNTFGVMLRNNLRSDNRGAIQLDWTFPMGRRFKGYAQYFNGYGESLIDYNVSLQRFGVGVLLTDVF